jgi:hypothetical protein
MAAILAVEVTAAGEVDGDEQAVASRAAASGRVVARMPERVRMTLGLPVRDGAALLKMNTVMIIIFIKSSQARSARSIRRDPAGMATPPALG